MELIFISQFVLGPTNRHAFRYKKKICSSPLYRAHMHDIERTNSICFEWTVYALKLSLTEEKYLHFNCVSVQIDYILFSITFHWFLLQTSTNHRLIIISWELIQSKLQIKELFIGSSNLDWFHFRSLCVMRVCVAWFFLFFFILPDHVILDASPSSQRNISEHYIVWSRCIIHLSVINKKELLSCDWFVECQFTFVKTSKVQSTIWNPVK